MLGLFLQKLQSAWKRRFGEGINDDLLYIVSVDRVLQLEDFQEVWLVFCTVVFVSVSQFPVPVNVMLILYYIMYLVATISHVFVLAKVNCLT